MPKARSPPVIRPASSLSTSDILALLALWLWCKIDRMIGVFDGILDLRSGLGRRIRRSDLFSHALHLPAGDMRIVAAVILIFAVYFPAALYLKHSHVASSLDLRPLSIMSIAAS